jgi:hypothetical protein
MSANVKKEELSRRDFFRGSSLGVGALALAAGAPKLTLGAVGETPPLPWEYVPLDPEVVRKKGHQLYFAAHCAEGAFGAIVDELKLVVGEPFTNIPNNMFIYAKGGMVGWASLCGAVNGASCAINLVTNEDDSTKLVNELLRWYTQTEFPSDASNQYAANGEFLVAGKTSEVLAKSVSGSILCHASVTNWCKESGYASGAAERSERCGRLAGDVAAKAVELLNQHAEGTFEPVLEIPSDTQYCRSCHSKGKDYELGQFTRGKMDCGICHDPHPIQESCTQCHEPH